MFLTITHLKSNKDKPPCAATSCEHPSLIATIYPKHQNIPSQSLIVGTFCKQQQLLFGVMVLKFSIFFNLLWATTRWMI